MADADRKRHITLIAGARPNFMKIAPLAHALEAHHQSGAKPLEWSLIHTGQHYDHNMSQSFFADLGIPEPHHNLGVGGGSQAEQTGRIMIAFEKLLASEPTRMVVVVGDVNSTLACTIVAKKTVTAVAHVEAGLRSGDMAMPEEINRIVTDRLSDLLFTTDPSAEENLKREGVPGECIYRAGNVMIDTLLRQKERAAEIERFDDFKAAGPYALLTLHRPSNVDDRETFSRLADVLAKISRDLPIIFPRHPRTKKQMELFGITLPDTVTVLDPLPYLENLNLMMDARLVLTDSGGLQEETTALGIPCITLRENTERPITIEEGTNELVGTDPGRILKACHRIMEGKGKAGRIPELWDGKASERIIRIISERLS